MSRLGRPPLPAGDRLDHQLWTRLTNLEAKALEALARIAGEPVSVFLRTLVRKAIARGAPPRPR